MGHRAVSGTRPRTDEIDCCRFQYKRGCIIPMRPYLPPGPHVPYEPSSAFNSRQINGQAHLSARSLASARA